MSKLLYCLVFESLAYVFVKNALHMFQQNHYELKRYSQWLWNKNNLHFSFNFLYILLMILISLFFKKLALELFVLAISILYAIFLLYKESNQKYIQELVLTMRVKRQIVFMVLLLGFSFYILRSFCKSTMLGVCFLYLPYLLIYPMAVITMPFEYCIKKHYENDARKILDNMDNLVKIGITGSFGKTSTKNIVSDILSDSFYTLMTPASYNTPMGITRTIREMLKPIHEVFVCEMGADKVNDISYLMDFVKPKYGIVTSIGPQHLSTFKSIENIIQEKMKEIEMLPSDGVGFINKDISYIQDYLVENDCKIVSVGIRNKDVDYFGENIIYDKQGTTFDVKIDGKKVTFKTALLGEHNVTNILLGIALARELGISIENIKKSVSKIAQIEHRLQLKTINGFRFIDDAFNSNFVGFKMAVDVLNKMPGKRVIVTPGLIDLGNKQDHYNEQLGEYMAPFVDEVVLVGVKQTRPIKDGLRKKNFDEEKVHVVSSIQEAFDWIYANYSTRDTILLENDLPDAFSK